MTKAFTERLAGVIGESVRAAIAPLKNRNADLEARIVALENRPQLQYLGTWSGNKSYAPGNAVTHHGSLWICKAAAATEPGIDHESWQLAVKRGRDGRDR